MAGPVSPVRAGVVFALALLAAPACAGDLSRRVDALAAAHPALASTTTLGSSASGQPLRALVIAAGEQPLSDRLGILVVAGLDGRRHGDGELLLSVAERLLDDEELAARLDGRAIVLLPVADPGGAAEATDRAGNRRSDDADRDGRIDEDGPDDLDGDGLITWMRVPDGAGEWVIDEFDPRAMRKARDDERGTHRLLVEGIDNDGDGEFGEDGHEGVLIDRNFAHGFVEHTATGGAYPLSEPEARALATFLLDHPGFSTVVVVGEDDTLVSPPKQAGKVERGGWRGAITKPLDGLLKEDVETLAVFTKLYKDAATGDSSVKAEGPSDGSLLAWAYHQAGRWPLGLRSWSAPEELPEAEEQQSGAGEDGESDNDADDAESGGNRKSAGDGSVHRAMASDGGAAEGERNVADADPVETDADADDANDDASDDAIDDDEAKATSDADSPVPAAVLAWLDTERDGQGFVPWTAYDHPDLGLVEIGGLPATLLVDPPADVVEGLSERLSSFLLAASEAGPVLAIEDVELTDHGEGLVTVALAVVNTGRLPTASKLAAEAHLVRPLRVTLRLPVGAVRVNGPAQVLIDRLEGLGGQRELRWVLSGVRADTTLNVLVDSDIANDLNLDITLP